LIEAESAAAQKAEERDGEAKTEKDEADEQSGDHAAANG
jgi:hypothetical protein